MTRVDPVKKILTAGFLLFFLTLHLYLKYHTQPSFEAAGEKAGQLAASFEATTLDSHKIQLASVAKTHQLTIVNFWETWCGPCKMELPSLQTLYADYKDHGLGMIGVYSSSSDESVQELIRQHTLTYPMVHDRSESISRPFGVLAVPTTFVIGPDLKILRSHEGVDLGLRAFIEKRLAEMKGFKQ